jgi:hypothetical protein
VTDLRQWLRYAHGLSTHVHVFPRGQGFDEEYTLPEINQFSFCRVEVLLERTNETEAVSPPDTPRAKQRFEHKHLKGFVLNVQLTLEIFKKISQMK